MKRLKFAARTIMGQSPSSELYTDDSEERPFLQGNAEFGERFPSAKWFCDAAPKRVPVGALLLSVRAPVGALNEADKSYAIGRGLCAVVDDDSGIEKDYAWYALQLSRTELHTKATGSTYDAVSAADVGNIQLVLPSSVEQRAIAAFLDRETRRVDRLMAKKRELNERLKEKRTALISRTVTHGLPPAAARAAGLPENPPLKPSGLDWLDYIPQHWEIVPLRYAFYNFNYRRIPVAGEDRANVEKIYPYYGASGIIDYVEEYLFDETLILVAEDGANLLSRNTPLAFLATGKYWVNNHAHILKPVAGDIRYWAAVLQTYDYTPLVTGAAQPKLTSDRLGGIRLPKPPPEEQFAIAVYLDKEMAKLDALVGEVETAVERLQEYRTALITAAVTGKIDVTKEAA